ncbi:hypothetical protein ACJMK2_020083 [Sinanodonta woodiana]|uniref:Syndetin n=1 Tax=Sinanodonta woodiana TaxID=1069815 RepID=A0ABD3TZ04_SINWO
MDLKKKLKSLIHKQDSQQSPVEEKISHDDFQREPSFTKFNQQQVTNPEEEQEVIDSIGEVYFKDETHDTSQLELEKLPEKLELEQIDNDRIKLRRQLQCVSRRVSELVLQNHPAYVGELQRVMELQKTLQLGSVICADARRQLSVARESFTTASLGLLANYRKRQLLKGLLKSLHTIKTMQRTDMRLREMMEEGDYCGAIQLCLECQKAAATFRHYKCISELSSKLQDTLDMLEEQLDVALSKICTNFDVHHYEKVQTAYKLLGKTQTAMDQLHMHFASAIHNTAFQIVLGYVELCSGTKETNFQKKQYADLCKYVTIESFTPCLIDLCKALWGVMRSYHKTMKWHEAHDIQTDSTESDVSRNVELSFDKRYIKQKLENGLIRIWQDVQQKVRTYILGIDLSEFKLDEFIQFLDLVNRMIEIGDEFCQSKSEGLQESLKQQSLNYFKNLHRAKMDELRMFLENEGWEMCPVKSNFHIVNLVEFRFMRHLNKDILALNHIDNSIDTNDTNFQERGGYFQDVIECSPFEIHVDQDENEDVFAGVGDVEEVERDSDSDSDIPDELKHDYIDEITGETHSRPGRRRITRSRSFHKNVSLVTNTSLNICRVIGKYMQMMRLLQPIAFDVLTSLAQLFDFYMYTVYIFFGYDLHSMDGLEINNRLKTTLLRIQTSLIVEVPLPSHTESTSQDNKDRIPQPHLSPIIDLHNASRLYGLAERIVAVESLIFLAQQLEFLEPHLETMIPSTKKAFLQQFYSQTVKMATELRKPVYWAVSSNVIHFDSILQSMSTVKWDIKEIMSQHNPYVDILIKNFADFHLRLSELSRHLPISRAAYEILWDHCIRLANRTFVDGYANAKKCTNEGRALMQLDFQQYLRSMEKLVDIRPIPDREYVETYIKAYYFPENQLESWLQEHREYTVRQLQALVSSVDHINKKARQKLCSMLEEAEKNKR